MVQPENSDLYKVDIPKEYLSRGTGESIDLHEATALDFMPRILGAQFMSVESLHESLHSYGRGVGSFTALEEGYKGLAEDELAEGNIPGALDAYKKALHNATSFVMAMGNMQHSAALNTEELDKIELTGSFGNLENKLVQAVATQNIPFDAQQYPDFVREARKREKRQLQLNQLFFMGKSAAYELIETPDTFDLNIGREFIALSAEMHDFGMAAEVARELGYKEEAARYLEQAVAHPSKETPKETLYLDMVNAKYPRDY